MNMFHNCVVHGPIRCTLKLCNNRQPLNHIIVQI